MACSRKTACISTLVVANSFILLGLILIIGWPYLYQHILMTQLTLHNASIGYEMWKETPIPMHMDVYLFNWTNAQEVVDQDWKIKPILEEVGPYVFTEHHLRVNVTWNDNNTVTFQQVRTWHFVPHLSGGTLDDKITNLNVIAATVGFFVRHKHYLIRRGVDIIMREKKETLFLTKTARELLFDGYDDELIDLLKAINATSIDVPFKKFGWFVERNESAPYDGTFTMHTGVDNLQKLGVMDRWNGNSHVPFYPGTCGDVIGTTGEMWPPVVGNTSVYMFASDMCSTVILDYDSPTELHGVEGSRYSGTNRTFDNGELFPEQSCFGVGEPTPTGVRNVSDCRFGAPAFLSFPHFYLADPIFLEGIEGIVPDEKLHKLYLEIEPTTGLPMNVKARAQVNIMIQPIHGITIYENVKHIFMPMMWFTQRATLTGELASQVKILLILPRLGLYTGIGFTCLAVFIFGVYLCVTCRKQWKDNEGDDKLIAAESSTSLST